MSGNKLRINGRKLRRSISGMIGFIIVLTVIAAALFAPFIAPHQPDEQNLRVRNKPPAWLEGGDWAHPLGTDNLGRDLYSRIIHGARVSVIVGLSTVAIQTVLGIVLGATAGYFGGWWDTAVMRFADVWLSIPFLVLAMAIMVVVGPGLWNTILVLGVTGWVTYARTVRAEVLAVKQRDFVAAAKSLGASSARIVLRHLLPNVAASMIVIGTLQVSRMIIAEASLSFLGLGIQPPQPAWGSMISAGRDYLFRHWWLATMPGLALMFTTLGINLTGDALRDMLDPTLRGRG